MKKRRQQPKRKPLLIDRVLAAKLDRQHSDWVGRQYDVIRSRLQDAKIFRLDEAAALYAAEMIFNHPDAIARDHEFAIPPFPRTYIELPYPGFYRALGGAIPRNIPEDADVGYFIDGPRAYVMCWSDQDWEGTFYDAAIMPVRYRLNQPFTPEEELDMCNLLKCPRIQLDAFFWGGSFTKLQTTEQRRLLRAHHGFELWYGDYEHWENYMREEFIISSSGDLRNILALTLFLNRTSEYQYVDAVPGAPAFINARPRTLLRHSIVRLKLDPKPILHQIYDTTNKQTGPIWHREHDVKAHFCHDKIARQHGHRLRVGDVPQTHEPEWFEIHVNCWKCARCGGMRWHKETHKRGTKNRGRVRTSYEVVK